MSNLQTVYKFDENGYFDFESKAQIVNGELLLPPDCVEFAPENDPNYWYKINADKTAWTAEKKPTTAAECVGIEVLHADNSDRALELRELFETLCDASNNTYNVVRDEETLSLTVEAVPEKTLEELKEEKLTDLKSTANGFEENVCKEMQIKSSIGYPMDGDRRSQANIQGLITVMTAQGLETTPYRCADDVTRNLTKEQLQTVYLECLANGNNLYAQKWALEAAINAAETKEELDAIEIKFKMMDFTNEE